jgi:RNA polymerase sigma factor (sigma-70 family)
MVASGVGGVEMSSTFEALGVVQVGGVVRGSAGVGLQVPPSIRGPPSVVAVGTRHQEALIKLAQHWEHVAPGNPEAFVRTVLYRDLMSWRRRHRRERLVPVPERPLPDASAQVDLRTVLRAGLDQLTVKQRAVLVLRYYDDLTETLVAEVLNVSVGTVRSQTHAALRRLRAARGVSDLIEEGR